jgi:hypothetical protein
MYAVKNNAVQHACFITLGFREKAGSEYPVILAVWGEGEAELIERFENIGARCADLFAGLADVIPSAPRGVFEYQVPQKLGAFICDHVYRTGDMPPARKLSEHLGALMLDYYDSALVPLDEMDTETAHDIAQKEDARIRRETVATLIKVRA